MKTALMFSGQGTQHPGMMGDLFEAYGQAREVFDKASSLLGRDIYDITMNSAQEELDRTENTQPCLLACELAALRVFHSLDIPYEAALGFSLGPPRRRMCWASSTSGRRPCRMRFPPERAAWP